MVIGERKAIGKARVCRVKKKSEGKEVKEEEEKSLIPPGHPFQCSIIRMYM